MHWTSDWWYIRMNLSFHIISFCHNISMKILHWADFELGHPLLAAVCRMLAGNEWVRGVSSMLRQIVWWTLCRVAAGVSSRSKRLPLSTKIYALVFQRRSTSMSNQNDESCEIWVVFLNDIWCISSSLTSTTEQKMNIGASFDIYSWSLYFQETQKYVAFIYNIIIIFNSMVPSQDIFFS